MDIFATGISRRVTKNSFCDFCAFCGEPAFLTRSHPILKKAEHHVCRQNDLPRCEFCKKLPLDRYFSLFLEIFSPFPTFGGALLSLLQPLRGPSPFFVALRGYLFAFSWKSFLPFVAEPSCAVLQPLRGPSWICFCLFALRGYPLPPSQPLANPSRSPTNPLVALRGPSCPFVDNSFSLRALRGSPSWISFLEDASHRTALLARPKGLAYYFCRGRETQ